MLRQTDLARLFGSNAKEQRVTLNHWMTILKQTKLNIETGAHTFSFGIDAKHFEPAQYLGNIDEKDAKKPPLQRPSTLNIIGAELSAENLSKAIPQQLTNDAFKALQVAFDQIKEVDVLVRLRDSIAKRTLKSKDLRENNYQLLKEFAELWDVKNYARNFAKNAEGLIDRTKGFPRDDAEYKKLQAEVDALKAERRQQHITQYRKDQLDVQIDQAEIKAEIAYLVVSVRIRLNKLIPSVIDRLQEIEATLKNSQGLSHDRINALVIERNNLRLDLKDLRQDIRKIILARAVDRNEALAALQVNINQKIEGLCILLDVFKKAPMYLMPHFDLYFQKDEATQLVIAHRAELQNQQFDKDLCVKFSFVAGKLIDQLQAAESGSDEQKNRFNQLKMDIEKLFCIFKLVGNTIHQYTTNKKASEHKSEIIKKIKNDFFALVEKFKDKSFNSELLKFKANLRAYRYAAAPSGCSGVLYKSPMFHGLFNSRFKDTIKGLEKAIVAFIDPTVEAKAELTRQLSVQLVRGK